MTDPTEPTGLPAERRVSDQTRARLRAELLHHARDRGNATATRPGRRRWVPATAAAAAVAAVGVGGTLLVQALGDGTGAPAGPPSGVATEVTPPVPAPSGSPSEPPSPTREPSPCRRVFELRRATDAGAIEIGETTVRLYENGTNWFVCDEWAALDGGEATLFPPQRIGSALARDQFRVSTNFSLDDPEAAEFVAGGALPDGSVTAIRYAFPDGHVEEAVIGDAMWAMAYFPTEGPLAAGGRNPPVTDVPVTVDYRDGTSEEFTIRYPMDFCAQVNHGC